MPSTDGATGIARTSRRLWLMPVSVVAAIVLTTMVSVLLTGRIQTPEQMLADAAPPTPSLVTFPAEYRVLAEPVVLRGQVRPGPSVAVTPPAAAIGEASVITSVPVRSGIEMREGLVVVVRCGEPMFAFVLPFPLWRDLAGGLSGPDVTAVQQALGRAGHQVPATGVFDARTQRAVTALYQRYGFSPPDGDAEARRRLLEATQRATEAERAHRVTPRNRSVELAVVEDEPSDQPEPADQAEVAAAVAELTVARNELAAARLAAGPALPRSAVLRIDRAGRRVSQVVATVGTVLTDPTKPLVRLDGAANFLAALVSVEQSALVSAGQRATVHDDVLGRTAAAEVTSVGVDPVNGADGQTGIEVRLRFVDEPMRVIGDRSVRIDIAAAASQDRVLAVPVTAVYSRADGGTFVTVVESTGRRRDVEVTAGAAVGGWVAIEAASGGVRPGDPMLVQGG